MFYEKRKKLKKLKKKKSKKKSTPKSVSYIYNRIYLIVETKLS